MKKRIEQARAGWAARTPRERGLVTGLVLLLAAAGLWYGVIAPLSDWRETGRARYEGAVARYRTVEAGIAQYRAASAGATARSGMDQPVRSIASARAQVHGVTIARVLPGDDGRLNLWVEQAEAGALMAWLADLERQYAISAQRITIEREAGSLVSAQLVLERR